MGYRSFMNRFSMTRFGRRIAIVVAARVDPLLYRISGGRITSVGPQIIPQLVLTTTGRKSGKTRRVQLGYATDGDDYVLVASNFGQEHHPGWSYNLLADPSAEVQVGGDAIPVTASQASESEKAELWPKLEGRVPQLEKYVTLTDRDIKVFRLTPLAGAGAGDGAS